MIEWKEGVSLGDWPIMSAKFGEQQIVIDNIEEGIYNWNYWLGNVRKAKGIVRAWNWDVACSKVIQCIARDLRNDVNKAKLQETDFLLWANREEKKSYDLEMPTPQNNLSNIC